MYEKYKYSFDEKDMCLEKCEVTGVQIGSETCRQCVNCKGFDDLEDWIKCSVLSKAKGNGNIRKLYRVDFKPVYPVGGCLILLARNMEEATQIASRTIKHTKEFDVEEVDICQSGVVQYDSGEY